MTSKIIEYFLYSAIIGFMVAGWIEALIFEDVFAAIAGWVCSYQSSLALLIFKEVEIGLIELRGSR